MIVYVWVVMRNDFVDRVYMNERNAQEHATRGVLEQMEAGGFREAYYSIVKVEIEPLGLREAIHKYAKELGDV